jgi:hypothetical protein
VKEFLSHILEEDYKTLKTEKNTNTEMGMSNIVVEHPGRDLGDLLASKLVELARYNIRCVYVDLPLSDPTVHDSCETLVDKGFCFSAIIPEQQSGDMLRMQRIEYDIDTSRICLESAAAKEIMRAIEQART